VLPANGPLTGTIDEITGAAVASVRIACFQ
jgi:hypothetical protein